MGIDGGEERVLVMRRGIPVRLFSFGDIVWGKISSRKMTVPIIWGSNDSTLCVGCSPPSRDRSHEENKERMPIA